MEQKTVWLKVNRSHQYASLGNLTKKKKISLESQVQATRAGLSLAGVPGSLSHRDKAKRSHYRDMEEIQTVKRLFLRKQRDELERLLVYSVLSSLPCQSR